MSLFSASQSWDEDLPSSSSVAARVAAAAATEAATEAMLNRQYNSNPLTDPAWADTSGNWANQAAQLSASIDLTWSSQLSPYWHTSFRNGLQHQSEFHMAAAAATSAITRQLGLSDSLLGIEAPSTLHSQLLSDMLMYQTKEQVPQPPQVPQRPSAQPRPQQHAHPGQILNTHYSQQQYHPSYSQQPPTHYSLHGMPTSDNQQPLRPLTSQYQHLRLTQQHAQTQLQLSSNQQLHYAPLMPSQSNMHLHSVSKPRSHDIQGQDAYRSMEGSLCKGVSLGRFSNFTSAAHQANAGTKEHKAAPDVTPQLSLGVSSTRSDQLGGSPLQQADRPVYSRSKRRRLRRGVIKALAAQRQLQEARLLLHSSLGSVDLGLSSLHQTMPPTSWAPHIINSVESTLNPQSSHQPTSSLEMVNRAPARSTQEVLGNVGGLQSRPMHYLASAGLSATISGAGMIHSSMNGGPELQVAQGEEPRVPPRYASMSADQFQLEMKMISDSHSQGLYAGLPSFQNAPTRTTSVPVAPQHHAVPNVSHVVPPNPRIATSPALSDSSTQAEALSQRHFTARGSVQRTNDTKSTHSSPAQGSEGSNNDASGRRNSRKSRRKHKSPQNVESPQESLRGGTPPAKSSGSAQNSNQSPGAETGSSPQKKSHSPWRLRNRQHRGSGSKASLQSSDTPLV